MQIIHAFEQLPDPCRSSLFLAGPTSHDGITASWRLEALRVLGDLGYRGAVLIPEPRRPEMRCSYTDQVGWEAEMRARVDLIAFWVPRQLTAMTNVQFGEDSDSCRCLYGRPPEAPEKRTLDWRWQTVTGDAPHASLRGLLTEAVDLLGEGHLRHGAERDVPMFIWRSEPFLEWYAALAAAGHTLRGFRLRYAITLGKRYPTSPLFGFLAWAAVAVAGENRIKANEVFLARPDLVAVLPLFDPGGPQAEAFLVREYRIAGRTPSGFVLESAGGTSTETHMPPRAVAVQELAEELGLAVDPARLVDLGSRQSAPTLCSHRTHLFALRLTNEEASGLRERAVDGTVLGADDEERIRIVRQPLAGLPDPSLDWTTIALLATAAAALPLDSPKK
jgi:8-oxo-dGTP pyrophosphatase MutT (NUDIX family)